MNKLILIICVFILFNSCESINRNHPEQRLSVKIQLINKIPFTILKDKNESFYTIKIDLINNTDSTVRFWTMTTSWWDNFIFNSDDICFYWLTCNRNFPNVKVLLPKEILTLYSIVQVCDNSSKKDKQGVKLGFILIKENEFDFSKDYFQILLDKKNRNKDIIWSDNSIVLGK